jgi:GNAT superfamily N-acetyltransferase
MVTEDIPAGLRLCRLSNWNQVADDWRVFLDSPGSGGFLAEKAGRAVGTTTFLRYETFAWIAMMLVDPEERRSGIGTRLMEQTLAALQAVVCVGLDATAAGEQLYRHFGFVTNSVLVRMTVTIETTRFRPSGGSARRMNSADLPDVLRRDREVFGADRGEMLESLFRRSPECAWVASGGYCFGRPGHRYHQLGPVVAERCESACDLVSHCCAALDGRRFVIDAPQLDCQWLTWLASVGFVEERPFVRMFRAGDTPPGQPARHYAITGPEFA